MSSVMIETTYTRVSGDNVIRLLWLKEAADLRALHYKPLDHTVLLMTNGDAAAINHVIRFWTKGGVDVRQMSEKEYTTAVAGASLCLCCT